MASAKIAITMDEATLHRLDRLVRERVFPNRSKAIQDAVEEKLEKLERNRLARECASQDVFNERSGTVIAVAITSQPQRAGFPLTLELAPADLPKRSWVKISQIRTLSIERIGKKIGAVSREELDEIIDGLNEIIGS
jgi:mRNA interferase MazF